MVEKVPQHGHCQICGKAIPIKESVCSEECKEEYEKLMKKRKYYLYIMYAAIFVVIIMFILSYQL